MSTRTQLPYNKTIPFYGKKLNYEVKGVGKPIILVHGAFTHDAFGDFKSMLENKFQVYSIHLPGFGASDSIPQKIHNTDLFSEALNILIKELKLSNADVIGLSLGTIGVLKSAATGNIKGRLFLFGVPGKVVGIPRMTHFFPLTLLRYLATAEWAKKMILVPGLKQNTGYISEDEVLKLISHTDPKALADVDYLKEVETDIPNVLKKVTNEVHFFYGESDPLRNTSKHIIKEYTAIPNSGHNPFDSVPEEAFKVLSKFFL